MNNLIKQKINTSLKKNNKRFAKNGIVCIIISEVIVAH